MQPQLPLELLDYILSFLQDDHASLRSCAEVNPVFSDMVERHLYHQITLTNLEGYHGVDEFTPAQLTKLFNLTPRLKSHVKVLRIVIAAMGILRWFMRRSMNDEDIGEILPLFNQLTTVFLSGRHNGKISWHRFHEIFQKSFALLLIQPSVENISINGIEDFPLFLLGQCSSLKRLSLLRMDYPLSFIPELSTESLPNEQAQLASLDIGDCSPALPTILTWLRSPHSPQINYLSSLRITVQQPEDIPHLQALLDNCSSNLKEVYVCANEIARTTYDISHEIIFPPETAPHQVLNFSDVPSLKSLTISGSIKSIDTFWISSDGQDQIEDYVLNTCVPWFILLLQTFSGSPSSSSSSSDSDTPAFTNYNTNTLERLVLKITFLIDKHSLSKLDWQPLSALLRSHHLFPSLKKVELRAIYSESTTLDYVGLMGMLRGDKYLRELVERGLLVISGEVNAKGQRREVKL